MKFIYYNYVTRGKILQRKLSLGFLKYNLRAWSIVFFGSDAFSLAHLKCLHEQMKKEQVTAIEVVVVNEGNPVYNYAVSNNLKTHFWPPNLYASYDLGVIASFGKFIPQNITLKFSLGILNVHGSLLPKWRGGMPVVHAVINGDTLTGITITRIRHDKWDAGEIIMQKHCTIGRNELIPSLMKKLTQLGTECLIEVINTIPDCLKTAFPQSEENVTFAPKLKKEAAVVKWSEMTALEVFNLHRGLFGTYDLTSTWKGTLVKFICLSLNNTIKSFSVDGSDTEPEPGQFTYGRKSGFLIVKCKDGTVNICSLKYNGKLHTGHSFHRGYLHKIPNSEWKFANGSNYYSMFLFLLQQTFKFLHNELREVNFNSRPTIVFKVTKLINLFDFVE